MQEFLLTKTGFFNVVFKFYVNQLSRLAYDHEVSQNTGCSVKLGQSWANGYSLLPF